MATEITVRFTDLQKKVKTPEQIEKEENNAVAKGIRKINDYLNRGGQHALEKISGVVQTKIGFKYTQTVANASIDILKTVTEYSVSQYFRLSEDYITENNLNIVKQNLNIGKTFINSVLSGAASGAAIGGAGGAVLGGVVSAVSTSFKMGFDYKKKVDEFERSLEASRVQTTFDAARAGLYNGGRGTEN